MTLTPEIVKIELQYYGLPVKCVRFFNGRFVPVYRHLLNTLEINAEKLVFSKLGLPRPHLQCVDHDPMGPYPDYKDIHPI